MAANPFISTSPLDKPLREDLCHEILYTALRAAARGLHPEAIPADIPVEQIRRCAHLKGPSVYLLHPDDVARIFAWITLLVYQLIESLYCSRLERSIRMVWHLVDAMARQAGLPGVEYAAVWAICMYLDERRKEACQVAISHQETSWEIAHIYPNVQILSGEAPIFRPTLVCVLDTQVSRVLAFRITDREDDGSTSLALYDAITSQRSPAREPSGLGWQLPSRIAARIDLTANCRTMCKRTGIAVQPANGTLPLVESLNGDWVKALEGRTMSTAEFTLRFDTYLEKVHGYGLLRAQEQRDREFSQQVGYNRDPAWQFPALRELLPYHPGRIVDGAVEHDGLHYADELLDYWSDQPVTLRRSEQSEARAWVYLDGEILCQAMARELRRQDGSYRPWR